MSRVRRAWDALFGEDEQARFATTVTSPRNRGDVTPYRTVNRDQPITATNAPPGARQQWQLYRVREESRDLELRSPIWGGYVRFMRYQCLGTDTARLKFDRLTREQAARLVEPIRLFGSRMGGISGHAWRRREPAAASTRWRDRRCITSTWTAIASSRHVW